MVASRCDSQALKVGGSFRNSGSRCAWAPQVTGSRPRSPPQALSVQFHPEFSSTIMRACLPDGSGEVAGVMEGSFPSITPATSPLPSGRQARMMVDENSG
jgi:hypothetical protein